MERVKSEWTPNTMEQVQNKAEYGTANPWECVDKRPVYTVLFHARDGREVELRWLKTYQHEHTGENRDWLCPEGESVFIFRDEWPDDDVLEVGPVQYHPFTGSNS